MIASLQVLFEASRVGFVRNKLDVRMLFQEGRNSDDPLLLPLQFLVAVLKLAAIMLM